MRKLEEELDSCMSTCVSPEQSLVATRLSSPSKLLTKVSGSLATIHISVLNCVENGAQLTGASCMHVLSHVRFRNLNPSASPKRRRSPV